MNINTGNDAPNSAVMSDLTSNENLNKVIQGNVFLKYDELLSLAKRYQIAMDNRNHTELRNVHVAVDKMLILHVGEKHLWYSIKVDRVDQSIKLYPVFEKNGELINLHFSYDLTPTENIKIDTRQMDVDLITELLKPREWFY